MQKVEINQIGAAVAEKLAALIDGKTCEWISEAKALDAFPLSKDKLKELRGNGTLEYRFHWKHLEGKQVGQGRGRSSSIIYHRQRMINYIESI